MQVPRLDEMRLTDRLSQAGCIAARDEARALLGAAPDTDTLDTWVERREQGEPLAWITGTSTFCGHVVGVDPGVYVPRWQSEELARRAAVLLPHHGRAVDLCTGAGAIAVHLASAVPGAVVIGTDLDERAVHCAGRNGIVAVVADLGEPLRSDAFDVVTAVAPYVPGRDIAWLPADVQRYEPTLALHGGDDGLDVVRRVVATAARLLRTGGWLLVEVGGDQDSRLAPTLESSGFASVESWFDDDGDLRGIVTRMQRSPVRARVVAHGPGSGGGRRATGAQ